MTGGDLAALVSMAASTPAQTDTTLVSRITIVHELWSHMQTNCHSEEYCI